MPSVGRYLSNGTNRARVFSFGGELRYASRTEVKALPADRRLDALISGVAGAVSRWMDTSRDWDQRGSDEKMTGLEDLRTRGVALFEQLAGENAEWLRRTLGSISYLDVNVFDWNIPWEFIYLGDLQGPVDLDEFLGSSVVVGRVAPKNVLPNEPDAPANDPTEYQPPMCAVPMSAAVGEDNRLLSAAQGIERAIFAKHAVPVHLLGPLRSVQGLRKLEAFLEDSPYLTHFNCHAVEENPEANTVGALELTERFTVPRQQLEKMPVREGSIVVLNCCSGHTLRHDSEDTVATTFADRHTAAVVAATCRIVDSYATSWARLFYDSLFAMRSVGDAIIDARRGMLRDTGDPACLVYGLFGSYHASLRDVAIGAAAA